ncbi:hypothetical protein DXF96_07150 [Heyndrickxia coagulans]|nr:hypothetical protein CIW84_16425 [Heyndrickxia coagulans]KGT37655.1 hypothetical protein P421_14115 [Heyndrickxia coagulans P38]AWP35785.1 hypothetical protein CYJ15_01585 [Heyndrickxia coagulans]KGB30227.1 hypothetical protein IE89_06100 [Heyndrickxia coagulans]KXT20813.1 hypothetical protein UZ35_07710 [Heyndrickxia coagulans]
MERLGRSDPVLYHLKLPIPDRWNACMQISGKNRNTFSSLTTPVRSTMMDLKTKTFYFFTKKKALTIQLVDKYTNLTILREEDLLWKSGSLDLEKWG